VISSNPSSEKRGEIIMPPVSHPFLKGNLICYINYVDHAPPHIHVKYQQDVSGYRIDIKTRQWLQPGRPLPSKLKKLIEAWVEVHEADLLIQWNNAKKRLPVRIVG